MYPAEERTGTFNRSFSIPWRVMELELCRNTRSFRGYLEYVEGERARRTFVAVFFHSDRSDGAAEIRPAHAHFPLGLTFLVAATSSIYLVIAPHVFEPYTDERLYLLL